MNPIRNLLEQSGVIKEGHFILTSGRHSNIYCGKDTINTLPDVRDIIIRDLTAKVGLLIPERMKDYIITGPAVAGITWAHPVAVNLRLPFVYPEKDKLKISDDNDFNSFVDIMEYRRGFDTFLKGKKVIIVEDIITTGKSVLLTKDAIERCGGILIGVVCIWNRSYWKYDNLVIDSTLDNPVFDWERGECPLCKENVPLTNPKTGQVVIYDKFHDIC